MRVQHREGRDVISDKVWDILEEQDIVPAPKLPDVGKVVKKAREKGCSVQVNYPADPDEHVMAVVARQGQRFTAEELKDVEAVAVALAECLTETEPQQMDFFEDEESGKAKSGSVFDEVEAHLAAVGESGADDGPDQEEDGETDEGTEADDETEEADADEEADAEV